MSIPLNPTAGWLQVAIFEVEDLAPALAALQAMEIEEPEGHYRVVPAAHSPAGCQWLEALVDFGIGERRAMRTSIALLAALQRAADENRLPGYRRVSGDAWLDIAAHQLRVETKARESANAQPY